MGKYPILGVVVVTAACAIAACGQSETGARIPRRVIDLSPPLTRDVNIQRLGARAMLFLGTEGRTTYEPVVPPNEALAFGVDQLCMLSHSGAHVDAPARLLRGGEHPGAIGLERLIGPARVLDLRWHDRRSALQITDLEQTEIKEGDVVVLFVGYRPPTGVDTWPRFAPLSAQASEWLVAKRVRAIATDMPAISSYETLAERLRANAPPEKAWAEYIPFFQAQIPVVAGLVNLEMLAREADALFVALPLPTVDGGGSPVRAAAFVY